MVAYWLRSGSSSNTSLVVNDQNERPEYVNVLGMIRRGPGLQQKVITKSVQKSMQKQGGLYEK